MRLLDLFCGAGGAAMGYSRAGFGEIVGVDIKPQPHYPFVFVQADAMTYPLDGFDAIHASPPCQAYSIMHNLPWIRGREYPQLLLPTIQRLDAQSAPYVVENVMGARHGAAGLKKRGLAAHGLKAGWLCGTMFGMEFYRHRLFASNFFWMAPGHPKHTLNLHPRSERFVYGGEIKGLPGGSAGIDTKPRHPNPVNTTWRAGHDGTKPIDSRRRPDLSERRPGSNGAQKSGVAVGHAAGWYLAAEQMGIDWMKRDELTQAIPPAYTEYIGRALLASMEPRTQRKEAV